MELTSPALKRVAGSTYSIAGRYTCDGADVPPPLSWKGIPPNTSELVLLVLGLRPANGKLAFAWAVAGLSPTLTGLPSAKLPSGAVVGRNEYGRNDYRLCPAPGATETYVFQLFAVIKKLGASPGFDPTALRQQAVEASHEVGLISGTYQRK